MQFNKILDYMVIHDNTSYVLIMEEKQSIIAAGAGASTKFVFEDGQRIERAENVKDVTNYISRIDEMIERKRVGLKAYLGIGSTEDE